MTVYHQVLYRIEELRIPIDDPFSPEDWKDWYHFILFNPASDVRLLFNLCFSGRPGQGEITVSVLLSIPSDSPADSAYLSYGYCNSLPWSGIDLSKYPLKLNMPGLDFLISGKQVSITSFHANSGISISLKGHGLATPVPVDESFPFGTGFIGWGLIPGMAMEGTIGLADARYTVDRAWYCYHDHNYGRFRWGGDIGWIWWVANAVDPEGHHFTYVFHRGNNSDFSVVSVPYLFIYADHTLIKIFKGPGLKLDIEMGKKPGLPVILPGTMASIFSDRHIVLPELIRLSGRDESDSVFLEMRVCSCTEFILPDNEKKQYTFLKELQGPAHARHSIGNKVSEVENGQFYAEYVY